MPELPEVETIARGLDKRVTGDVIESVWLGSKPEPLKSPAAEIAATLEHSRITGVRRMGKHIVIDLERVLSRSKRKGGARAARKTSRTKTPPKPVLAQWIVHLGMTGSMLVCSPDSPVDKHTHAIAQLASGRELRFVDPRRFGRLSVSRNGGFEAGGFEPLDVDLETFIRLFHGR
jgi:formamidopyrimidine-DNA glycosylase